MWSVCVCVGGYPLSLPSNNAEPQQQLTHTHTQTDRQTDIVLVRS